MRNILIWIVIIVSFNSISVCAKKIYLIDQISDFVIYGASEGDRLSRVFDSVGDVNNDGNGDIMSFTLGRTEDVGYLVFGSSISGSIVDLADSNTNQFMKIIRGNRVGSVGDLNGDGIIDFGTSDVGYDLETIYDVGKSFIGYGQNIFPNTLDLNNIELHGVVAIGSKSAEWLGNGMRQAGDFNGDGYDDVMIQGWDDRSGNIREVIILFGGNNVPEELSTEDLGEHGVILTGAFSLDKFGDSFAPVGDVNGDGLDDVLIGADAEPPREDRAYLVYGSTDFPSTLKIDEIGARGIIFSGSGEQFGVDVSGLGDINLDGYDDFVIAAPGRDSQGFNNSGAIHIIFGATDLPSTINTESLDSLGITIEGNREDMILGFDVIGRANLNGDNYPDFVTRPSTYEDDIYVFPGGPQYSKAGHISIEELDFIVIHNSKGGLNYPNVIRFGDINGDGLDDILIGDEFGDLPLGDGEERDNCGAVYVVFGSKERFATLQQRSDLNGDGVIDKKDLFLFQEQWGVEE